MLRTLWALGLVVFLAACGGGSSTSTTMRPVDPPTPTVDVRAELSAVYAGADTAMTTDVPIFAPGFDLLAYTTCSGTYCEATEPITGFSLASDTRDGVSPTATLITAGEQQGVPVVRIQDRWNLLSYAADIEAYGGWLQHSYFDVGVATITTGDLRGTFFGAGSSVGNDAGSRPAGSATWRGAMVGGTIVNRKPEPIRGDAAVIYDFDRSAVNVSFTNIRNIERNAPLGNMGWSSVPVSLDGSFQQSGTSGDVEGTFYGPAHEEVGGIFFGSDSLGAFGAKR